MMLMTGDPGRYSTQEQGPRSPSRQVITSRTRRRPERRELRPAPRQGSTPACPTNDPSGRMVQAITSRTHPKEVGHHFRRSTKPEDPISDTTGELSIGPVCLGEDTGRSPRVDVHHVEVLLGDGVDGVLDVVGDREGRVIVDPFVEAGSKSAAV